MNDPMTLIERLRNPAYHGSGFSHGRPAELDVKQTVADMAEAANEIERIRKLIDPKIEQEVAALITGWQHRLGDYKHEVDIAHEALLEVCNIANIPPSDERFGSLAERMNKVWLLSRGFGIR